MPGRQQIEEKQSRIDNLEIVDQVDKHEKRIERLESLVTQLRCALAAATSVGLGDVDEAEEIDEPGPESSMSYEEWLEDLRRQHEGKRKAKRKQEEEELPIYPEGEEPWRENAYFTTPEEKDDGKPDS